MLGGESRETTLHLTKKAEGLHKSFIAFKDQLPINQSERLGVVIPARKASHFMRANMLFLSNQIQECVEKGKISGADVVVVLNRGGVEDDRVFANQFLDNNMTKLILYERSGHLYKEKEFLNETDITPAESDKIRAIFIIQEDIDGNAGHTNALRTGFNAFVEVAKKSGKVNKYYLTTDTDNRIYAEKKEEGYSGNGLLALMDQLETNNYFAAGAKVEPVVTEADGNFNFTKKVTALIRATANLHTTAKGFQWSPGGGTLAKGADALAAHAAVTNENMEVPDVSFTVLTGGILNKMINVSKNITVLDDAPEEVNMTMRQLISLKNTVHDWAKSGQPLQELVNRNDIPSGWKKLVRWMQGQKFAEAFFGKDLMSLVAQPHLINIVLGNLHTTLDRYHYSKDAIKEIISLIKEFPSYLIIKSAVRKKNDKGVHESAIW